MELLAKYSEDGAHAAANSSMNMTSSNQTRSTIFLIRNTIFLIRNDHVDQGCLMYVQMYDIQA